MKRNKTSTFPLIMCLGLGLTPVALIGCDRNESAADKLEDAADDVKDAARDAADEVKDAAEDVADGVKDAARELKPKN